MICPVCGKEFAPRASGQKFCSRRCNNISRFGKRICPVCEKEFVPQFQAQVICSKLCINKQNGHKPRVPKMPAERTPVILRRGKLKFFFPQLKLAAEFLAAKTHFSIHTIKDKLVARDSVIGVWSVSYPNDTKE